MIERTKYKNIIPQQNKYFFDNLEKILILIKPDRIVEIGTGRGATTRYMSDICKKNLPNAKIKTFDIKARHHFKPHEDLNNVEFCDENIFNYNEKKLIRPNLICGFLSKKGVNLILCDGGNKIAEFITLSPILNVNDIIMAHDYAPNKKIFENEYNQKVFLFARSYTKIIKKYNGIRKIIKKYNFNRDNKIVKRKNI
jgi:hypothetical protein